MQSKNQGTGYLTEVSYVDSYILHHNPNFVRFLLLVQGIRPPKFERACELGFGTGFSLAVTASAYPGCEWWGNDFNPDHVAVARHMTASLVPRPHLLETSFEEMAAAIDKLPEFDFICLHGIWSWVSEENRKAVLDIISRRLKPGGVVSTGYNTYPYWAAIVPLRNLLSVHAQRLGGKGRGILEDMGAAMNFAGTLANIGPKHFQANPLVPFHLEIMKQKDRNYLVHEYLNESWTITDFAQVHAAFEPAGLSYAGRADADDIPDAGNLTPAQASFVNAIDDLVLRETVRDMALNRQTRHDFWVKGDSTIGAEERDAALREFRLVAIVPRIEFLMTVYMPTGEVRLREDVYVPIADLLKADDYRPKSLDEIATHLAATTSCSRQQAWDYAIEAACTFLGLRYAAVLAPDTGRSSDAHQNCAALNRQILERARSTTASHLHLASPIAGGAIWVRAIHLLFIEASNEAGNDLSQLVEYVMRRLVAGQPEHGADLRAEISAMIQVFLNEYAPLYAALGVMRRI